MKEYEIDHYIHLTCEFIKLTLFVEFLTIQKLKQKMISQTKINTIIKQIIVRQNA